MAKLPLVALVGRPNVGKSTLFNRLTRTRDALVDDTPGLTRDRQYGEMKRGDTAFPLVDTGGFEADPGETMAGMIRGQTLLAIEEADIIVFVVDGGAGPLTDDYSIADKLRSSGKPVIIAANKAEKKESQATSYEFHELGLDPIIPISSAHGIGIGDLLETLEAMTEAMPEFSLQEDEEISLEEDHNARQSGPMRLAVVGCPNAGKSSLINRLVGEERVLASDIAGTTRDSVDVPIMDKHGEPAILVDTAGIRRKSRVSMRVEKFAVIAALKSMERAEVAILVLDAQRGVTDQDKRIGSYALDAGCGLVFAVNKWDTMPAGQQPIKEFKEGLAIHFPRLTHCPVFFLSAKSGKKVDKLIPAARKVRKATRMRISTANLNRWLEQAIQKKAPPRAGGRPVKVRYCSQVSASPPTFVFFCNRPEKMQESYKRYLENQLREAFDLDGTPVRMMFKGGANPFAEKGKKRR
ncbi:ribosome biogenesis GTPase Der [Magnetococcus sp. PR-3]|uniref:ribosome biogenesis GTPase Der n=1 Tax=Magnetococcus sp. PR-3 TaxID=3120355 RepID=UPI002FCE5FF7